MGFEGLSKDFCVNSGDNKPHFIPGMMGPFLGVTLVPQTEVRNIMIPIFHDMMDWEQRKNGNFKQVNMTFCLPKGNDIANGFVIPTVPE